MNRVLAVGGFVLASLCTQAQGTMNIHEIGGFLRFVEMDALDSVGYQTSPPPDMMVLYYTGGQPEFITVSAIDSITYSPGGPEGSPQIATWPPIFPSPYGVTVRGWVGEEGASEVLAHGICYGTSPLPDLSGQTVSLAQSTTGLFEMQLAGLQPGTLYYARAFATNAQGTAYGNQVSFTTNSILNPALTYGTLTDQDGNIYATIAIGTQTWMAGNLRSTTYANGDPIPHVPDTAAWAALTTGAWSHVENTPGYVQAYGRLYNSYAVMDPRNVCPTGWHVPSDEEWQVLESTLGMPGASLDNTGYRGGSQNVGGKMKLVGQWANPNTGANNSSGFSGLPAGLRNFSGTYAGLFFFGFWWSTTPADANSHWVRVLTRNNAGISRDFGFFRDGNSVRCVMD